jgi:hypothetical protein
MNKRENLEATWEFNGIALISDHGTWTGMKKVSFPILLLYTPHSLVVNNGFMAGGFSFVLH